MPPNGFQLQVGSHMTCEVGEMRPCDELEFSKWQEIWLKCPSGQHCSNKSLWETSLPFVSGVAQDQSCSEQRITPTQQ